jgi:hypothetical protein
VSRHTDVSRAAASCVTRILNIHNEIHEIKYQSTMALSLAEWHNFKVAFGWRLRSFRLVCACVMCSRSTAQLLKQHDITGTSSSFYCNKDLVKIIMFHLHVFILWHFYIPMKTYRCMAIIIIKIIHLHWLVSNISVKVYRVCGHHCLRVSRQKKDR